MFCRLNYRLTVACQDSIQEKCADACSSSSIEQPCGGTVLKCLTEKVEEITSEDCKKEVFYFQKMEVQDFRNDVILAETCRNDVDQYCAKVEAGKHFFHYAIVFFFQNPVSAYKVASISKDADLAIGIISNIIMTILQCICCFC